MTDDADAGEILTKPAKDAIRAYVLKLTGAEGDEKLPKEAKDAIRQYMLRLTILPAAAAAVLSFIIGFAINEVARGKAYTDSIQTFSSDINHASREVEKSKTVAEFYLKELEKARDASSKLQSEISDTLGKVNKLQSGSAANLAQIILTDPELRSKVVQVNQSELAAIREDLSHLKMDLARAFLRYRTDVDNLGDPIFNSEPKNSGGGYSPGTGPGRCAKGAFVVGIQPIKAPDGTRAINFQCGVLPNIEIK